MIKNPIKIMVLGSRGIPNIQGGVETHIQNLYPIIVKQGYEVSVIARKTYLEGESKYTWNGVEVIPLYAPLKKSLEAIVHTFLGVLYAGIKRPDILHIHAIGPSLFVPLARLLGLKVVVTHHGPDYDRKKWGWFGKGLLKLGECWGCKYSNATIAISKTITNLIYSNYKVKSFEIPNGVVVDDLLDSSESLIRFGLDKQKYILMVSRLVPEKNHLDLLEAFKIAKIDGWKLVLVGNSEFPDEYSNQVEKESSRIENVIMTGYLSGQPLKELFTHAGMFVLPSSHEGLPIALLEALSFGLPSIASDIPANLEVGLPLESYFQLGNVEQLSKRIVHFSQKEMTQSSREKIRQSLLEKYDWHKIAHDTTCVYRQVLDGKWIDRDNKG